MKLFIWICFISFSHYYTWVIHILFICTYDPNIKECSYVNHIYVARYNLHINVHMIPIWFATCDTYMTRYTFDTNMILILILIWNAIHMRLICGEIPMYCTNKTCMLNIQNYIDYNGIYLHWIIITLLYNLLLKF